MENYVVSIPTPLENTKLPDPSLLNFYKDLEQRTYWIISEVTDDMLDLVQYILKWNQEDYGKPSTERRPIRLIIASSGGSLEVEQTLVAAIKLSKTPVYAYAIGCVASAASVIYLACHKRFATSNAYFVLHKGSCQNISGNYNEVMAMMEDYMRQVNEMVEFYKANTLFTEDEIEENINSDWYVGAELAVEKGLVTKIVSNIDEFYAEEN